MNHVLKTNKVYFQAMLDQKMNFNTRNNDRSFQTGDTVIFEEVGDLGYKTGRHFSAKILYVLSNWQQPGHVTFGYGVI